MDLNAFEKYLDSLIDEVGVPSVDMIIRKDHEQIYRFTKGFTDWQKKRPVDAQTLYMIFSMTKISTMTAVMQLVEQGKLSLEDEVGKYLPAYYDICVKNDDGQVVKCKNKMLIKHLVSMQSGLDYDLMRPGIVKTLEKYGKNATTRQLVDSFVETPLMFEPGTHFFYSLSHDVAAAVVEVISGMSFGEYLKKNVFEPLGMKNTFFGHYFNEVQNLSCQFSFNDETGKIGPIDPICDYQLSDAYESGGAGLISCTDDYSALADALSCMGESKTGARILKPESIERIRTNLLGPVSLKDIEMTMGRTGYGYGVGMQVLQNPELLNSPARPGVFGWDGAAASCTIMYPEEKLSLVLMLHVRNFNYSYGVIHPKLRDLLFS